jgi:nicotinate-nucleotide pyrophosphorylase (carboxylating)
MKPAGPGSAGSEVLGLSPEGLRATVMQALSEDLGEGDLTTRLTVPEGRKARGTFYAKQSLVLAGVLVAAEVFQSIEPKCEFTALLAEGTEVPPGEPLAKVQGEAATLLSGERVALNFLQRLSGIATLTRAFKNQIAGLKTELLDTRKTTPGLRSLEKYAVRMGGGCNHRLQLDDGILIKNNHLLFAGGVRSAVETARARRPAAIPVEVEVRTLDELEEAIAAGADIVLLDNMTPELVARCVERAAGRVRLEVSGGVNLESLRAYAETGVDRISVGALTHSAPAVDINFLIEPL